MEEERNVFINDEKAYGETIKSVPKPQPEIGIDNDDSFLKNIIASVSEYGTKSQMDMSKIDEFSSISQSRDTVYGMLDVMAQDSKVAAILETYAADATEYNDEGKIVWVESPNSDAATFVSYLLKTLQVDKHIYSWVYSLIKYGDAYLRLYKESEYDNSFLFRDDENWDDGKKRLHEGKEEKEQLNEDVIIKAFKKSDKFVHYLELIPNPASVFELTKFGKTQAYIQADTIVQRKQTDQTPASMNGFYRYSFKRKDVEVYQPTMFVHACLEDASNRDPETVEIFYNTDYALDSSQNASYEYRVRRGKSLLYDNYKAWRCLSLLENSILLNRVTKSSITRIIGVEVGDMPKERVGTHLRGIKSLMEQKAALNVGDSMSDYTNPGPLENIVYIPTRNGQGAITQTQIGGDVNIRDVADLDYYTNIFYGSFRVPKAYFGFTDDGAGFNGGTSLSIVSSRYAKEIKRIQSTILQALTTAINIMLIDKGMDAYVNEFTLRMLAPTTQEELDRRENTQNRITMISDLLTVLDGVDDPVLKLKITKSLISTITTNEEIMPLIDEQIAKLENAENDLSASGEEQTGTEGAGIGMETSEPLDLGKRLSIGEEPTEEPTATEEPTDILPTPDELGIDMTQNEE